MYDLIENGISIKVDKKRMLRREINKGITMREVFLIIATALTCLSLIGFGLWMAYCTYELIMRMI